MKNKIQSIKPLYELTKEERAETKEYPLKFFQLLDNANFREITHCINSSDNNVSGNYFNITEYSIQELESDK